jgi:signal transduction histidine kinase
MPPAAARLALIRTHLARLTLLQRFALTGGAVMVIAMLVIGSWVTSVISARVVESTAAATALFMDSYIAPLAQELDSQDALSIGPTRALEELLAGSAFGQRVVSIKIWKPGGLIAYAADPELIGRRFAASESLEGAFQGRVMAELDQLDDPESADEKRSGLPLLEIYSPIRQAWSGRVIAVAEFYEDATSLSQALAAARRQSWAIVAAVTGLVGIALFGIVHQASRVIEEQRSALKARVAETERMSTESRQLRLRAERASSRLTELNERLLRRISADLHDGPAQLVGLAALRLSSLAKTRAAATRERELAVVDQALSEAIREIRNLCNGLSLPDIDGVPIDKTIERVVRAHEMRTGTKVTLDLGVSEPVPHPVAISAYRFVQEGLNNAYRHGGGLGQTVDAALDRRQLIIRVGNDLAPGEVVKARPDAVRGLGLAGLRERIESLGGTFRFDRGAERAEMTMALQLDAEVFHA